MLTPEEAIRLDELEHKLGSSANITNPSIVFPALEKEIFDKFKRGLEQADPTLRGKSSFSLDTNRIEAEINLDHPLVAKITEAAKIYFKSDTLEPTLGTYFILKKTKGVITPIVPAHLDSGPCTYVMDIIIDRTFSWPLYVSGEAYDPDINGAVIFSGENQLHYRPDWPDSAGDSDYYKVAIFNFIEPDHWSKKFGVEYRTSPEAKEYFDLKTKKATTDISNLKEPKKLEPNFTFICRSNSEHIYETRPAYGTCSRRGCSGMVRQVYKPIVAKTR